MPAIQPQQSTKIIAYSSNVPMNDDLYDNDNEQNLERLFKRYDTYPDAHLVFGSQLLPLDDIKNDCIVVLDTNVLLVPYSTSKKALTDIEHVYSRLATEKRLIVPGQVAREFAEQRSQKLAELYSQLSQKVTVKAKVVTNIANSAPILWELDDYQQALEIETQIAENIRAFNDSLDKLNKEYQEAREKLSRQVESWYWNDPVSALYSTLFTQDVVFDISLDENEKQRISHELLRRKRLTIPPGYKDVNQNGTKMNGAGDFIIWKTILELGKRHKKSVLFISNEEKADWFVRQNNKHLYPRFELVHEFQRASEGNSFHITKFSDFLKMFEGDTEVIEEIEGVEEKTARMSDDTWCSRPPSSIDISELPSSFLDGGLKRLLDYVKPDPYKTYSDYQQVIASELEDESNELRNTLVDFYAEVSDYDGDNLPYDNPEIIVHYCEQHALLLPQLLVSLREAMSYSEQIESNTLQPTEVNLAKVVTLFRRVRFGLEATLREQP